MPTPNSAPSPAQLSCINCRQRKIKCDKTQPCSACTKSTLDCVFPAGRVPRRSNGGSRRRNGELQRRLNQLENIVERLGGEVAAAAQGRGKSQEDTINVDRESATESQPVRPAHEDDGGVRPIVKSDGGRYLEFWASLIDEVDGLRQLLNESSDTEDEAEDSPRPSGYSPSQTQFTFDSRAEPIDMERLRPPAAQSLALCSIFFARVDPVFKVLHRPTVRDLFQKAAEEPHSLVEGGRSQEALMFAVYFAAVTSMTVNERTNVLGLQDAVAHFKHCAEVALVNADYLNATELNTLQAFVIYLMCLRSHNGGRSSWTLLSLAVRIAHALDLHYDGEELGLSPYETELRRRLWHEICTLDIRACEDRGSAPLILEHSFSTRLPLNINDDDLDPGGNTWPVERTGCTEMTFCLIGHEACLLVPKIFPSPSPVHNRFQERDPTPREIDVLVSKLGQHVESKYLAHCDLSVPIYRMCSMVARLITLKLWLVIRYPLQRRRFVSWSEATKEEILEKAVTLLELCNSLETESFAADWAWFSITYIQWHPLAVTLAELCVQTQEPVVTRAWAVVEEVFSKWENRVADSRKGPYWRPIRKLLAKARKARAQSAGYAAPTWDLASPGLKQKIDDESAFSANILSFQEETATKSLGVLDPPLLPEGNLLQPSMMDMEMSADAFAGLSVANYNTDPINWDDWDEFIRSTWYTTDPWNMEGVPSAQLSNSWMAPFDL